MTKVLKRKQQEEVEKENEPKKIMSDEPAAKKIKWINRQRVLVFATRGINHRHRHLMEDLKKLMPHHRPECKMERTKNLQVVNEMCEMKNCNKAILFDGRKKRDLYVWFVNVSTGPSAKFLIENIYTMGELKMTGNCLKGSRPLLSFDEKFTTHAHYSLLKELLTQIFGVPNHHPKSQPFFDHVYTFSILDNRIWFRNFQILTEDGGLAEIGPRFVLNPVKIFAGSFGNDTLWDNPHYISPAKYRQSLTKKAANKYLNRVVQKMAQKANKPDESYALNPTDEIFKGDVLEKAKEIEEKLLREEQKMAQKANKPDESYALNPTDEIFKGDVLEKAKEIEEKLETFDKSENMEKIMKKDKGKSKKRARQRRYVERRRTYISPAAPGYVHAPSAAAYIPAPLVAPGYMPAPLVASGYMPAPPVAPGYVPAPPAAPGYVPAPPAAPGYVPAPPASAYMLAPPTAPGYVPALAAAPGYVPAPAAAPGYVPAPAAALGYVPAPPAAPGYMPAPAEAPGYVPAPAEAQGYVPAPPAAPEYMPAPAEAPGYVPAPAAAPGYVPAPAAALGYVPAPPAAPGYMPAPAEAPGYVPAPPAAPGYMPAPAAAPGYVPAQPGFLRYS